MSKQNRFFQFIKDYIVPVGIVVILYFIITIFFISKVRVNGPSMEPNLKNNQSLIVWKQAPVKHLSVVVFNASGVDPNATGASDYYVKRVIGLPGDKVSFKNGSIYINDKKLNQKFISSSEQTTGTQVQAGVSSIPALKNWTLGDLSKYWKLDKQAVTVPKGKYFVLGDHRSVSNDSRYWGFVPKNKIMGVVHAFGWPWPFNGNNTSAQQRYYVNSLGY